MGKEGEGRLASGDRSSSKEERKEKERQTGEDIENERGMGGGQENIVNMHRWYP